MGGGGGGGKSLTLCRYQVFNRQRMANLVYSKNYLVQLQKGKTDGRVERLGFSKTGIGL